MPIKRCEDYITPKGEYRTQWLCKCDCGNKIKVQAKHLKSRTIKTCGHCNDIEFVDPYDGVKHCGSVKNICDKCGFRDTIIYSRLKQGFTFEETISIKSSVKISKICKINFCGKHFEGNLKQICEYFNKSYDQVYEFMTYNKTLEWALEHTNDVV